MKTCHSKCHSKRVQSTVSQSRLGLFEATWRRPPERKQFFVSGAWGTAVITGRLSQVHRNLLDVLPMTIVKEAMTPDGCRHLLIDPHTLKKAMSRKGKKVGARQCVDMLKDLTDALVEIKTTSGLTCIGHILDEVLYQSREVPNAIGARLPVGGKKGGERVRAARSLWRVKISASWMKFIEQDLTYKYDIGKVMALQSGVSAAAARLLLTHKNNNIPTGIETVLTQLGIKEGECQERWNARRRLAADAHGLADLGIRLEDGTIKTGSPLPQNTQVAATEYPSAATEYPVR